MIRNYTVITFRSLWKRKFFSILNISALALAMTASFLICLYVWYDSGYDGFLEKNDRLFRVKQDLYYNKELTRQWSAGPMTIGEDLKANFPEVVHYTRMVKENAMLDNGTAVHGESNVYFGSEAFFTMFSIELLSGTDSLVLSDPFTMVLSESMARKYFGSENPVGKTLKNNGKDVYEITGVFKDFPDNSHMKIDALLSFSSYIKIIGPEEAENLKSWWWVGYYTYIELAPGTNADAFAAKLPAFVDHRMGKQLREYNEGMSFVLQPVTAIHQYSNCKDEMRVNGDGKSNQFLILVAAFILIMAWINYVNLSTAKSVERAREIGVRKVMGSSRRQLIYQFLAESLAMQVIALVVACVIVAIALPYFSRFVDRPLSLNLFFSPTGILFMVSVIVLGVILSGLYPAFILSSLKPVTILKGNFKFSMHGQYLRKSLVVVQFVASTVLVIGTYCIYRQISFIQNSKYGVDIEQVLVVNGPNVRDSTYLNRFNGFRQSLKQYPGIEAVAASSGVPGRASQITNGGVQLVGDTGEGGNSYWAVMVDEDYKEVFNVSLLSGRNFSRDFKDNWKSAMVNETAMKLLGIASPQDALGRKVKMWSDTLEIVGVLKNFHHESPKKKVDQLIFICDQEITEYYSIRINRSGGMQRVINTIESQYKEAFPGNAFRYFFLDDYYNNQYHSDVQFGNVFGLFSIVAIVIACLGLFGLSSYMAIQRTKEVGIRKVLGATIFQITALLSREFLILLLVANVLAWPLSYLLLQDWLSEFASRMDLTFLSFFLPATITILIALMSVSLQFLKTANADPVDTLRSE